MLKEKIGFVTEEEKNAVLAIFERKMGLEELLLSMNNKLLDNEEKDSLYEKIVKDMGETKLKLQAWWDEMYSKYKWKSAEGGNWNIDFQTNEIILICND